jgi:hypothetical protein
MRQLLRRGWRLGRGEFLLFKCGEMCWNFEPAFLVRMEIAHNTSMFVL